MKTVLRAVVLCWLAAVVAPTAPAQDAPASRNAKDREAEIRRAELARRLRGVEEAWARADVAARRQAIPQINAAMMTFFGGNQTKASRQLDDAYRALAGGAEPVAALGGLDVAPLIGAPDRPYSAMFRTASPDGPPGADVAWSRVLEDPAMDPPSREIDGRPQAMTFNGFAAGNERHATLSLRARKAGAERPIDVDSQRIAIVPDFTARLAALRAAVADAATTSDDDARATLAHRVELIVKLSRDYVPETPVDALALFRGTEAMVADAKAGDPWKRAEGDFLAAVRASGATVPVRLFLPPIGDAAPRPLVVAVHGAGGSENMWFEAYDRGRLIELARERRWIVASPLASFAGAPVDAVVRLAGKLRKVDAARVALVGHSMGSGVVLAAAAKEPARYAATAAVSGNGRAPKALDDRPVFVGFGAEDPLLRGRGAASRRTVPAAHVVKEYPDVEHVMIMRSCLDDVVAFFERAFAAAGR